MDIGVVRVPVMGGGVVRPPAAVPVVPAAKGAVRPVNGTGPVLTFSRPAGPGGPRRLPGTHGGMMSAYLVTVRVSAAWHAERRGGTAQANQKQDGKGDGQQPMTLPFFH